MAQPTDQTVRLVWEGMIGVDRMHRYFDYLLQHLQTRETWLRFSAAILSSGALVGFFLSNDWRYMLPICSFLAAALNLWIAERNHVKAASHSLDMQRQLHRLMVEWKKLWADVDSCTDADIRARHDELAVRTARVTEEASSKVPLVKALAERSENETYKYWSEVHA